MKEQFQYIENPMDYIDEIIEVNGQKIALINCEDWFEQYEDESCLDGWRVPYSLLSGCDLYLLKFEKNGQYYYHGMALYSPEETYLEDFDDYDECVKWLVGEED